MHLLPHHNGEKGENTEESWIPRSNLDYLTNWYSWKSDCQALILEMQM